MGTYTRTNRRSTRLKKSQQEKHNDYVKRTASRRTVKSSTYRRSKRKLIGRKSRRRKYDVFHSLGRKENKDYA